MPSNHLILCCGLLLLSSIFSGLGFFFPNELGVHIRWPKCWSFSFSFSISSYNEYSGLFPLVLTGLISFCSSRTLKSLLQHHHLKASVLYGPALTIIRDYRKDHSLTIRTFVGKVMSLHFNTLSRFVIAFLPKSNHLIISWLQSPSAVLLEPKKGLCLRGNPPLFPLFPFYLAWNHEARCHDLSFFFSFTIFSLKLTFSLSSITLIKRFFSSS